MSKARWVCIFLLLVFFVSIFTACTNEPIKIGLSVDLTGRASEIGISGRNGAEIAVDEINQRGGIRGRKINLIIKDDKGLPEEAVKVDNELVNEGIRVAVGHIASGTGVSGLEVFKKAGILMISPTMSTESLSGIDDNFIRVIDSNREQGKMLADVALRVKKTKGIAIVYEYNNRAYSQEVCKYFRLKYEKAGGKITLEESFISSPSIDYDALSRKIIDSGAEGALIVAGGLDLGIFAQKLRKARPEIEIYSGMWAMTGDLIKNGGKAIEGIYLPGVYEKENRNPDFLKFRETYMRQYREEPSFSSIYCYETVRMIGEVLEACKEYDTASIKKQIYLTGRYNGLQNDFNIDSYGDTDRGYFLFKVQNGGFVRTK